MFWLFFQAIGCFGRFLRQWGVRQSALSPGKTIVLSQSSPSIRTSGRGTFAHTGPCSPAQRAARAAPNAGASKRFCLCLRPAPDYPKTTSKRLQNNCTCKTTKTTAWLFWSFSSYRLMLTPRPRGAPPGSSAPAPGRGSRWSRRRPGQSRSSAAPARSPRGPAGSRSAR